MDQLGRIESKIDALLKAGNVTWEEPMPEPPPELTEAQKQALSNAPVVAVPPGPPLGTEQATSEEAQQQALANAPTVKVPGTEGEIASVTVETEQPTGETDVTTVPDAPTVPRRR